MSGEHYGVHSVVNKLTESLRSYIEAQYHIRNEGLIRERRKLLEEHGAVAQDPFIESTPVYETGRDYSQLKLPEPARAALTELAKLNVGIFARPYVHQEQALENFLADEDDIIVATGTGSGKTESFLMPIIGHLALEGASRPQSARMHGCRAMLLYPMNALVNDQLSRIRRLFGTQSASSIISKGRGRPVTFGSYTGRTPYPGARSSSRDSQRIEPLFEGFYLPLLASPSKVEDLNAIGQWPSKDLAAFYAKNLEEIRTTASGKERRQRNWNRRLFTQPNDRELMTRHEMQANCPDILITNYSMLEYMLSRPIERPIFTQTKEWLHSHPDNELIFVLDEAHMYRGAGGAEVALLLRRVIARLEVPRERIRFILTSASLGEGEVARQAVVKFAHDLTGLSETSPRRMTLITGTRERRTPGRSASEAETAALAKFDLAAFHNVAVNRAAAVDALGRLAQDLQWPAISASADLQDYLFARLNGFGPLEELIQAVAGAAVPLRELGKRIFGPDQATSELATAALIALATFARRESDQRVLLPTRLHMFFRGLPSLFACCDPDCDARRDSTAGINVLGRLHTHLSHACVCSSKSRMYELLTHRECGSAFLKGYLDSPNGDFLWHMPSGPLREGHEEPLIEIELLVEKEPHHDREDQCVEAWLDVRSGRLVRMPPTFMDGFRKVYIPAEPVSLNSSALKFAVCPVCNTKTIRNGRSAIMDHATKGEAPFANLVKTQLDVQPPTKIPNREFPNAGRKVLLFSDGRQKAARLARDIPREVEQDIFRQVITLAAQKLRAIGREPKPNRLLYVAVLSVLRDSNLPIFDREDARKIENEIERLDKDHSDDDFETLLSEFSPGETPSRYRIAILRQLCGRYYSLLGTSVGYLAPSDRAGKRLLATAGATLPERDLAQLTVAWLAQVADGYALDRDIPDGIRATAAGFWTNTWGSDGHFAKGLREDLPAILGVSRESISKIESLLSTEFMLKKNETGELFLDPEKLRIQIGIDATWHLCRECTALLPITIRGHCAACGAPEPTDLDPGHSEYIRARKGFWREPVKATLSAQGSLRSISVEEHTAQLSNRDNTRVHATTERYELRFRDVQIDPKDRPIDVLSCTTTMEVGVDIGSLVAVGLRNVPPQRENYQQRAGRAGRRGSSVSSVFTYAQNGPHDSHYYYNPEKIVAGAPRTPEVKIDNSKIARRHVHSFLIQTFFHSYMDAHGITIGGSTSALYKSLGKTKAFFGDGEQPGLSFDGFTEWMQKHVLVRDGKITDTIVKWLPPSLRIAPEDLNTWVIRVGQELLQTLSLLQAELHKRQRGDSSLQEGDNPDERNVPEEEELLEFLFEKGLLPSYAFPTDLASFLVERIGKVPGQNSYQAIVVERPQQGLSKALSEYAPGRLIVIDKETYRSGGVVSNVLSTVHDRASPLFESHKSLIHCNTCSYVQDLASDELTTAACPVCNGELRQNAMIVPEVFTPENGRALREDDREQDFTYATSAQFPVPVGGDDLPEMTPIGENISFVVTTDRQLVTANKGQLFNGEFSGFWVCNKCGFASTDSPPGGEHQRPYPIEFSFGQPKPSRLCNGQFENVFLGHTFSTDLLLLRVRVASPIAIDTQKLIELRTIEDALYSTCEAIRLAASRHTELDLDPAEFGSGFRIVPGQDRSELLLDMYLYDTLSGGAGYAELAGRYLPDILQDALTLLEECPTRCERSCESCLQHYHNQHVKDRLDRKLGAQLLRFALTGRLPTEATLKEQAAQLAQLSRLLKLDGYNCEWEVNLGGSVVPLLVEKGGKKLAIGVKPSLLEDGWDEHSLCRLQDTRVRILNDYILSRNLPDEHQLIRNALS